MRINRIIYKFINFLIFICISFSLLLLGITMIYWGFMTPTISCIDDRGAIMTPEYMVSGVLIFIYDFLYFLFWLKGDDSNHAIKTGEN